MCKPWPRPRADLAVAEANLAETESLLTIAACELERVDKLQERGVSSESQRDVAQADQLAKQAHVAVGNAQVTRAQAALATTRIRLGYTEVTAGWRGNGEESVTWRSERRSPPNEPLFRIVDLDPIKSVFFVTEGDDALLTPVFWEATRLPRVELRMDNPELRLKPGMFVRATVVLEPVAEAAIVPQQARTTRDGRRGAFVLNGEDGSIAWRPVEVGVQQGDRISGQSILSAVMPGRLSNGADMLTFQGLLPDGDHAISHRVPNLLIDHAMRNPPIPPGFWRGVNINQNVIYMECFRDELARAAGVYPLEFRRKRMADHPKSLAVVNAVAEKAGWAQESNGVHR